MKRALQTILPPRAASPRAVENLSPRRAGSSPVMAGAAGAVFLTVIFLTVMAGFARPVHAECLTVPNQAAPAGAQWSVYIDPATSRRCWTLVDAAGREVLPSSPPAAAAAAAQPPAAQQSPSAFQMFFGNFTGLPPPPPPQPAAPQEIAPAAVPDPPAAIAAPSRKPRHAARTEQKTDGRALRQESAAPSPPAHEMSDTERNALFQEFLRWHETQKITGGLKGEP